MVTLIRRIQSVWTGVGGSPYYTSHYYDASVGTDAQAHAATANLWVGCKNAFSDEITVETLPEVQLIDTTLGDVISTTTDITSTTIGGKTDTLAPPSAQFLAQLTTGVYSAGRQIRGRFFIPGVTVGGVIDGKPAAAVYTVLQTAADAWLADVDSAPVVWSRTGLVAEPVSGVAISTQFAILRSRRD